MLIVFALLAQTPTLDTTGESAVAKYAGAAALGMLITAIVTAIINLRNNTQTNKLKELDITVANQQKFIETLQKERDRQDVETNELFRDMVNLRSEHVKCQIETAQMKEQMKYQEKEIRLLQASSGTGSPQSSTSVTVTATIDGTIIDASPSAASMFHYLSSELVGKNVDMLVADSEKHKHKAAFDRIQSGQKLPPEYAAVVSIGRTKEGYEIPVTVTLTSWQDEANKWLICAEIMHRRARPIKAKGGTRTTDPNVESDFTHEPLK